MNTENTSPVGADQSESSLSAFLPLTLLAVSFLTILSWQASNGNTQRNQLEQAIAQREATVQQSKQVQSGLEKLVLDLVAAGKDDKDAQAIIAKYNIQLAGKPAVSGSDAAPAAK